MTVEIGAPSNRWAEAISWKGWVESSYESEMTEMWSKLDGSMELKFLFGKKAKEKTSAAPMLFVCLIDSPLWVQVDIEIAIDTAQLAQK
jgi:hypothetical protein